MDREKKKRRLQGYPPHSASKSGGNLSRDETYKENSLDSREKSSQQKPYEHSLKSNSSSGGDSSNAPPLGSDGKEYDLGSVLRHNKQLMQSKDKNNGVTMIILGSSGCGKSTVIKKILLEECYDGPKKDKDYIVVIYTQSAKSDAFDDLPPTVLVDKSGLDEEAIKLAYQMNMEYDKKYNFVYILDDVIHIRYKKQLEQMFLTMRNLNITSIVSLQYPKLIPPSIRISVYFTFCFCMNNQEGIEQIVRGWLAGYLVGNNIREKMQSYREWTEGANGKRFFMLDNLNHTCYQISEKYMCKKLEMVSFTHQQTPKKKGRGDCDDSTTDEIEERME